MHSFSLQCEYFNEAVLEIERNNVSAIEVAQRVEVLRANILLRRDEKYLDPNTDTEKKKLIQTGEYDETQINAVFQQFYG